MYRARISNRAEFLVHICNIDIIWSFSSMIPSDLRVSRYIWLCFRVSDEERSSDKPIAKRQRHTIHREVHRIHCVPFLYASRLLSWYVLIIFCWESKGTVFSYRNLSSLSCAWDITSNRALRDHTTYISNRAKSCLYTDLLELPCCMLETICLVR